MGKNKIEQKVVDRLKKTTSLEEIDNEEMAAPEEEYFREDQKIMVETIKTNRIKKEEKTADQSMEMIVITQGSILSLNKMQ